MFQGIRVRSAIGWLVVGLLVGISIALGAILITGVSVADEAAQPLGVDTVSVQPTNTSPSATPTPTPTPTPSSTHGDEVIDAPDPIEVEIGDDHGGDDNGGSSGDDNSGHGGGSDSGSDDSGSDDSGSDGGGSGGSGSDDSGSGSGSDN